MIDYDVDSDDEWEDEADGESIADSDKGDMEEDTLNGGDDEDDDGFFVPHGHLSDDELDEEERNVL
jgi:chromatin assembly factor 1 subunit A